MQALLTLIASTVCILDRLNFKNIPPSLAQKLKELRNYLNEISKLGQFAEKISESSFTPEKTSFNCYSSLRESHFQKKSQSLHSQKQNISINSGKEIKINQTNQNNLEISSLEDAYYCLIFKIRENYSWISKQSMIDLVSGETEEEEENAQQIREINCLLNEFRNKLKYFMAEQKSQDISHQLKPDNSGSGNPQKGDSESQSSVRSLLTQKLKQLHLTNHNDDDVSFLDGKIVVKSSLIMKEMMKHSGSNATEPAFNKGTLSEGCLGENPQSVGIFSTYEPNNSSKSRQMLHKTILKELNFQASKPRERKAKKEKTGCAQCDIY